MRWFAYGIVGVVLIAAVPVQADDQAEGAKVIDRAIKAAGGEAKLKTLKAVTLKGKGKVHENSDIEFSFEASVDGLDRMRLDLEAVEGGQQHKIQVVSNGEKVWAKKENGEVDEPPPEIMTLVKTELLALRGCQTLLPLRDKGHHLAPLGEARVNDKPAMGVRVSRKDLPDVSFFFDKETGLPVKAEMRVKEDKGGMEATHEWYFSDYKEIDGIKHPMKVSLYRDGKKFLEGEVSEVKAEEKLDDSVFAKP